MEEQVVKKRAWVKNAVIVFLSIMLVLTFFSNTIMNRSLPEVATAYVESGSINAKIRGSGTVTAGESYDVVMDQTRKVASVLVRVGDVVSAGDVLFTLAETESDELKQAMDALDAMRLAYEKQLLNVDVADYAQENRNIEKARKALADAQAEMAECTVSDLDVMNALTAVKDAERAKTELDKAYAKLQADAADVTLKYDALEAKILGWEQQMETLAESIETYEDQIRQLEDGTGDLEADLKAAEKKLKNAKETYASLRILYGADYDALKEAAERIAAGSDVVYQMAAMVKSMDPNDPQRIAFEKLQPVLEEMEKYQAEVDRLTALINNQDSVQEQIAQLEDALEQAEESYSDLRRDVKSAKKDLEEMEEQVADLEDQQTWYQQQTEFSEQNVEQLTEQYNELKEKQSRFEAAEDNVESCQTTLEDLIFSLAQQQKADGKLAASQQMDLDNAKKEILEQEELIAELQLNALGAEVTAKVGGQISSLNVSAGRDAAAGDTLAVIEVVDRGYTVRLPVTNEQSKKVRIGDKAEVTNYYWGEQIDATLTQIANDPGNPGQGKMLVFTLTGDISSGQNVSLSVGERSARFDAIVPNSALRTDTNGTFVFVITAKASPLGNRYIATRADVQVLGQDDTTAAISGLSAGEYVITTSSKPLEAGMQVNMVEN